MEILYVCVCLLCVYSFFSDNQYPDEAKREEIAAACNSVIQKPGGINPKPVIMEKCFVKLR